MLSKEPLDSEEASSILIFTFFTQNCTEFRVTANIMYSAAIPMLCTPNAS